MTGEPASETPFRLHDPEAVLVRISGAVGDLVEAAERVVLNLPGLIALLAV